MPGQTKARCPSDASGKNFVVEFAIEKMDFQASHLQGSNVRYVLPNGCHQVKQRFANFQSSNKYFVDHMKV